MKDFLCYGTELNNMLTENQIDKIRGTIYGQAIGDALGLGTEFMDKKQVQKHYPFGLKEFSEIIQDSHRKRWIVGDWTDDTDQALCIIDSILIDGKVNELSFADQLYKWFNGTPLGIGKTVLQVLQTPQFRKYPHKASEFVWKLSKYKTASNGALMRTSVLGLWEFWDKEKVKMNTEQICKVTHYDPRCVGSCVITTSIISNLLLSDRRLTKEELISIGSEYDNTIAEYINASIENNLENLKLDEKETIGFTLKALSAGLWTYFNSVSFEEGLLKIINEGGDADTNAAIACSILGTKYGYNSIPLKYIDGLYYKDELEEKTKKYINAINISYANITN